MSLSGDITYILSSWTQVRIIYVTLCCVFSKSHTPRSMTQDSKTTMLHPGDKSIDLWPHWENMRPFTHFLTPQMHTHTYSLSFLNAQTLLTDTVLCGYLVTTVCESSDLSLISFSPRDRRLTFQSDSVQDKKKFTKLNVSFPSGNFQQWKMKPVWKCSKQQFFESPLEAGFVTNITNVNTPVILQFKLLCSNLQCKVAFSMFRCCCPCIFRRHHTLSQFKHLPPCEWGVLCCGVVAVQQLQVWGAGRCTLLAG